MDNKLNNIGSFVIIAVFLLQGCSDLSTQRSDSQLLKLEVPAVKQTESSFTNPVGGQLPTGEYRIVSWVTWADSTYKTVGVEGASALKQAKIEQRDYVENQGQEWNVTSLGNGEYSIVNVHSEQALDVPYGIPNEGVQLWQYPHSGGPAQQWLIEYQGFGVYRIKSKVDTTMGVHVENASTSNGTEILLETFADSGPMQGAGYFMFYPVDYTKTSAKFVGLPDTQSYVEWSGSFYDRLTSQINWILANKENVSMVLQQGDLTNRNIPDQWDLIEGAFTSLDNEVPYVLAVGNHDMGPNGNGSNRNTTYFNQYFPYSTMSDLPAFGGIYESGKMDNAYYLLETGPYKWLIVTLEFGPRASTVAWADSLVKEYPDRTVILNTHAYTYSDSTHHGTGDSWNPHLYGIDSSTGPDAVHDGEELWEELVRSNSNIRFVFSGHVLNDGCGILISTNDAGYPVYQLLANFQDGVDEAENGGDGYLRDMTVDFENEELIVMSYSAYPGIGWHTSDCHNFEIYPLEIVGQ